MLCCEIPQLVCTHQRNVTGGSNVIKKKKFESMGESDCSVPIAILFPVFTHLNSLFFFPFPNPPQSPALKFCPASLVSPYLFIFFPLSASLYVFQTCHFLFDPLSYRSISSGSTLSTFPARGAALTSGQQELRLHQNFCLAPWCDLESARCSGSPGELSW